MWKPHHIHIQTQRHLETFASQKASAHSNNNISFVERIFIIIKIISFDSTSLFSLFSLFLLIFQGHWYDFHLRNILSVFSAAAKVSILKFYQSIWYCQKWEKEKMSERQNSGNQFWNTESRQGWNVSNSRFDRTRTKTDRW